MATRLCASFCLDEEVGLYEVDRQIAAANSIPEGPPVDTIALHPSVKWIAHRDTPDTWEYIPFRGAVLLEHGDEADSWPVIYDPTKGVHTGAVINAETQSQIRDVLDGPTAQQEPGESLSRGLDDLAAGRVSRRDDYLEPEDPEYCGNCDGRKCMGCVFREYDHDCADDCPDCCTTARTPRVVDRLGVDEQGSRWRDKVGDKWWFSSLGGWRYQSHLDGIAGTGDPVGAYAPYVELIEPRVLPSLDCEEARDGTEWKFRLNGEPRSLVYRNNGWRYGEVGDRIGGRCGVSDGHAFIREFAPYIEVVGDPS